MKVLVTGSKGFLGTYVKNNISYSEHEFIYGTTSKLIRQECKDYLVFDSLYQNIDEILSDHKVDVIIHLASIIPKTFQDADYKLFDKNITMMNNLYKFSVKNHLKKFIYLSGFGSMNDPKLLDIKDFYTMSKITCEHFCAMMSSKNIKAVSLRVSAPYGEFSKAKNVINIFIEKALKNEDITVFGTGKREQNFTYAGDIINAIKLTLKKDVIGAYSIVGEKNVTMLDLAKLIIKLTNSKSKIVLSGIDEQENYRPNYSYQKAYKDFGYKPKFSLEEGLKKYIKWYKNK
jgi:nucleoside-diphosphate-sugar epimerase